MQIIADLHLHSKYSRAVSPEMVLGKMAWWGKRKGINLLGTGDFTHPLWLREIKANLEEAGEGIYGLKNDESGGKLVMGSESGYKDEDGEKSSAPTTHPRPTTHNSFSSVDLTSSIPSFLLSTEISSIYSQGGKLRRIHNIILSPSIEICEKINNELVKRGCNLHSDGRPIIGLPAKDLVKIILEIDPRTLIIPAHVWTPWFSVYGSQSGFDSLEECFGEMAKFIYGVETGLSSDPAMNWRIKELDHRSILSNSDAHSGPKLGREATVFEMEEVSFGAIREAIMGEEKVVGSGSGMGRGDEELISQLTTHNSSRSHISHTLEFYPEEGKYHYTGHRACGVKQTPEETRKRGTICPTCGKKLTVGVMHRVDQLADPQNQKSKIKSQNDENGVRWIYSEEQPSRPPYAMLVPLQEIIAESMGTVPASIKVQSEYNKLVAAFAESSGEPKGEFRILLKTNLSEIRKISGEKVAEGIKKVRAGEINVDPGYDGVFGVVKIWASPSTPPAEAAGSAQDKQMSLF